LENLDIAHGKIRHRWSRKLVLLDCPIRIAGAHQAKALRSCSPGPCSGELSLEPIRLRVFLPRSQHRSRPTPSPTIPSPCLLGHSPIILTPLPNPPAEHAFERRQDSRVLDHRRPRRHMPNMPHLRERGICMELPRHLLDWNMLDGHQAVPHRYRHRVGHFGDCRGYAVHQPHRQ